MLKQIKGHGGAYLVNSNGSIFNQKKGKYLKGVKGSNGYLHVTLCYGKKEDCSVHRLVAEAFIPNPDNLPCVNHKDENKTNNAVENLEWCSYSYNITYGTGALRRNSPVLQLNMNGELIKQWGSIKEASEKLGIKYQGISRVCRRERQSCGGFRWRYAERR